MDHAEGDAQHAVEHHVLEDGHREHDAGEGGRDDAEIGHDLRDHGDAGDGDGAREDEHEGGAIVRRADQAAGIVDGEETQPGREGNQVAEHRHPGDRPPLALPDPGPERRSRAEHEQEQAELVHGAEKDTDRGALMEDGALPGGQEVSEQSGAEDQAPDDLARHPWLPKSRAQLAAPVRTRQHQDQGEQQARGVGIAETHDITASASSSVSASSGRHTSRSGRLGSGRL